MNSILAGIFIAIGCIVNLQLGGIAGAVFFPIGLITILIFNFDLFTGRASLLSLNKISFKDLGLIWVGNLIGASLVAAAISFTSLNATLSAAVQSIIAVRIANGILANTIFGIGCGLLVNVSVMAFNIKDNSLYVIFAIGTFILCGFNHCIADCFYLAIGGASLRGWLTLIPTSIGNLIGCNLIYVAQNLRQYKKFLPF